MAIISDKLNKILSAVFGKDVRQALHDGLDAINREIENTTARQKVLEETFNQLTINAGNSNAEIVAARVKNDGTSFDTIGKRLNDFDEQMSNLKLNNVNIIVTNSPPPIEERVLKTFYFKVTDTQSIGQSNCNSVKVSPNMGIKIL